MSAHVRQDAAGLAALPVGDPEREEAYAHARDCEECARALREGERLQDLLLAAPRLELPSGALARASETFLQELARESRRRATASAAAALAVAVAVALLGEHRGASRLEWALGAGLALAAVSFAALSVTRSPLALAASVAAGLLAALIGGLPGPFSAETGLHCLAMELAAAAVVVVAGRLAFRDGSPAMPPTLAASAAAGALAADAGLQLTCAAHSALPHLLAFHVTGLLLAAAAAAFVARKVRWLAA